MMTEFAMTQFPLPRNFTGRKFRAVCGSVTKEWQDDITAAIADLPEDALFSVRDNVASVRFPFLIEVFDNPPTAEVERASRQGVASVRLFVHDQKRAHAEEMNNLRESIDSRFTELAAKLRKAWRRSKRLAAA